MKIAIKLSIYTAFFFLIFAQTCFAQSEESFSPAITIGDGSDGRVWSQWKQSARELAIEQVIVRLKKLKGGSEAYVNLRFNGGQTFENGKREYLKDNGTLTLIWEIGGEFPRGRTLVLNAYKSEVFVESVRIRYRPALGTNGNTGRNDFDFDRAEPLERPLRPSTQRPDYSEEHESDPPKLDSATASECRKQYFRRARIEVEEVRPSGGLFSSKQKVYGNIIGACIEEAGYFERGRLKERFAIPYTSKSRRYEFKARARTGRNGEIRVYTSQGQEERLRVDEIAGEELWP